MSGLLIGPAASGRKGAGKPAVCGRKGAGKGTNSKASASKLPCCVQISGLSRLCFRRFVRTPAPAPAHRSFADALAHSAANLRKVDTERVQTASGSRYFCDCCFEELGQDDERWHCAECEGFDLCTRCRESQGHPHHTWLETCVGNRLPMEGSCGERVCAAMHNFANRWCFGTRTGDVYTWSTFAEVKHRVLCFAAGMRVKLRVEPQGRLGICGRNCEEWLIADLSCLVSNVVSIPLEPTATEKELSAIVVQCELTICVCTSPAADTLARIAESCPSLRQLVAIDSCALSLDASIQVVAFSAVEAAGQVVPQSPSCKQAHRHAHANELVTVIYTSGSTGSPKGAMLSDAALCKRIMQGAFAFDPCVVVSYMPLAHFFDRGSCLVNFFLGGRAGFHCGEMSAIFDTLKLVRPSTFSSTPRLWNVLHDRYLDLIGDEPLPATKAAAATQIREELGGRVKAVGTGGAKTSPAVLQFMRSVFRCSVTDGFGTTETGAISSDGIVGAKVDVFLLDCPEMGYTKEDRPFPRGELCVRSEEMVTGYFMDEESTRDKFWTDGSGVRWYRTGDICECHGPGKIMIVDRVKNLFKLAHGEFIAPQHLEQLFEALPLIQQCFVTGFPDQSFPVAVVVVDAKAVLQESPEAPGSELERRVMAALAGVDDLRPFERPCGVVIETEPWTPSSGLVTGTLKPRRPQLEARYQSQISLAYARVASVSSGDAVVDAASEVLLGLARRVLNIRDVDDALNRPLRSMLADSLVALRFVNAINDRYGTRLPVTTALEEGMTLASMSEVLAGKGQGLPDFRAETLRAEDLQFRPALQERSRPASVFLTGATGFIGVFLLAEVLRQLPDATIYCLVRVARSDGNDVHITAMKRLKTALAQYGLLNGVESSLLRVRPVAGDLSSSFFGLAEAEFVKLGTKLDLILHCGAHVHSLLPYSVLQYANVGGTHEALKLAQLRHSAPPFFVHISTVGVLPASLVPLREDESVPLQHLSATNGYAQSKWVAEKMVLRAFKRGLRGCVVRPASVFCHSESGHANLEDFVIRALCGMAQLRAAPELPWDRHFADLTPVDCLVRAVLAFGLPEAEPHVLGRVLNCTAPEPVPFLMLISWLRCYLQECGGELARLSWGEWKQRLADSVASQEVTRLYALSGFFTGTAFPGALRCRRDYAAAALQAVKLSEPRTIDAVMVRRCFARLHHVLVPDS